MKAYPQIKIKKLGYLTGPAGISMVARGPQLFEAIKAKKIVTRRSVVLPAPRLPLRDLVSKQFKFTVLKYRRGSEVPEQVAPAALGEFKAGTVEAALAKSDWALITGTQEALGEFDSPANLAANEALREELKWCGLPTEVVAGSYCGIDQGVNFLVTRIGKNEALTLGRKYRQESVGVPDGLMFADGRLEKFDLSRTVIGDEARKEKAFTILPDGTAVSLALAG